MIDDKKCLIRDSTYTPIDVVSVKTALGILAKGKAAIHEAYQDIMVRSAHDEHKVPRQLILQYVVKKKVLVYNVSAQLNNRNLFLRDNKQCQYCGRYEHELGKNEKLTRDHVLPRSLGGKDTWLNVVTACRKCNGKKDNNLLEDVGMTLLKKPTVPPIFELMMKSKFGEFLGKFDL